MISVFVKSEFKNFRERGFLFLIARRQQAKIFFVATTKDSNSVRIKVILS